MVAFFLNMCANVMAMPLKMAGRYNLSMKLIGFCSNTFALFVNDAYRIIYLTTG